MLEIFQSFEQMTGRFSPSVLIASGIIIFLLGLCVWIAGHSLRKVLIFLAGLAGGVFVGLYVVGRNALSALIAGGLAGLIALILERVLVVLLAAAMAAAIAFTILAEPYFVQTETVDAQNDAQNDLSALTKVTLREIPQELKTFGLESGEKIKQAGMNVPVYIWTIIAAVAAIFLVCGMFLWRLASALFFSVTGTVVIFLGMILLLSYKGTEPISHIRSNPFISAAIFFAMIGFGAIVQLLLCKDKKKEKVAEIKTSGKKGKGNKGSEKVVEHDWRSA